MKRIKDIFSALKTLRRVPSAAISDTWSRLKAHASLADDSLITEHDVDLIDSLITAIISIAKDDEDKAAASGKDGK